MTTKYNASCNEDLEDSGRKAGDIATEPKVRTSLATGATANRLRKQSEPCPECGGFMIPESGCWVCVSCGYGGRG